MLRSVSHDARHRDRRRGCDRDDRARRRARSSPCDDRIAQLGTTLSRSTPQRIVAGRRRHERTKKMTIADVRAIEERSPHVLAVQPQQDKDRCSSSGGNKNTNIAIFGVTANYLDVRKYEIDRGRDVHVAATTSASSASPCSAQARSRSSSVTDPIAIIGEKVRIGGMQFTGHRHRSRRKASTPALAVRTTRCSFRSARRAIACSRPIARRHLRARVERRRHTGRDGRDSDRRFAARTAFGRVSRMISAFATRPTF